MTNFFGPNTRGVLHLMSHLYGLGDEHIDTVVAEWKRQPAEARAAAWAAIWHATTSDERSAIRTAAALARRDAMAAAVRNGRTDWAFWAAAWDAAAAVAALGRISEHHYRVLAGPMAGAMPWLAEGMPAQLDVTGLPGAIVQLGARDG
jgi:hypothetical protein